MIMMKNNNEMMIDNPVGHMLSSRVVDSAASVAGETDMVTCVISYSPVVFL